MNRKPFTLIVCHCWNSLCNGETQSFRALKILVTLFLCLMASGCNPNSVLSKENLLRGARAETFILSHGALCAPLPSLEAIDAYARDLVPENSAVGREVKAWDLSGLLDIVQARDGRWVILPSKGLQGLEGAHVRTSPNGNNDAVCFGRLWVEDLIDYQENQPFGVENAVTARFKVSLKDGHMLKHFKDLKVESFEPKVFALETGQAFGAALSPSFNIEMALRPTTTGWYLAKGALREEAQNSK